MPTENSLNVLSRLVFGLNIVLCLAVHLYGLADFPGLHYDEAWAMNYAWQIGFEPGFWPWRGMSAYTMPWTHYWAAGWMKLFGPSLFVFRLSQVGLSLGAIFLFTRELFRLGFARAAMLFPVAVLLVPGLVLNHRFAIELNGFHLFLFALLFSALARGRVGWAAFFFALGTTAHILFYGLGLALVAACLWEKREFTEKEKRAIIASFAFLAFFFFFVLFSIPERGKAGALVLSALGVIAITRLPLTWLNPWPRWRWLPFALAATFLFNLVFFAEGQWTLATFTGDFLNRKNDGPMLTLFSALLAWMGYRGLRVVPPLLRHWFFFGLFFSGLMMLKPAPRYFELPLFCLALLVTFDLVNRQRRAWVAVFALAAHAAALYYPAYLRLPIHAPEREIRFLFFKDSSRDFLSKQELVRFLGGAGCSLSDIKFADSRVMEALRALARADWKTSDRGCRWTALAIHRSTEHSGEGTLGRVADFVIEGKTPNGTQ